MEKKLKILKKYFFTVFCLCFTVGFSQGYPHIIVLSLKDPVFTQFVQDVEIAYKDLAGQDRQLIPSVYTYKALQGDTLMSVSARCSLPYETLATINRLSGPDSPINGKTLYLPTVPGLFVVEKPETALEEILYNRVFDFAAISCYTINDHSFYFFQGLRLSPTERAFFLDTGMRSPLPQGIVTSAFGRRVSPISGKWSFHSGIDLAAPKNTPVLACKTGQVKKTGFDGIYGKYVVLIHENGMESLYAHMETVVVVKDQRVTRGEQIGKVGTTGASTGPHLHFEIQVNGETKNPGSLF